MPEAAPSACQPGPDCTAERCRWRCAVDVVDELLRLPGAVTGAEMDQLLDFCDLRISMERRHYLAFFRIRRWLENHLAGVRRSADGLQVQRVPVRLDHYCVEAVRRVSLCTALMRADSVASTRLEFEFVNWPVATPAPPREFAAVLVA
jgi:hypothetical protein